MSLRACAPSGPERWFDSEGTLNHSAPSDLDTYPLSDTQMRSDDAGRDFPASAGDPSPGKKATQVGIADFQRFG
jgi:hypothetical protein